MMLLTSQALLKMLAEQSFGINPYQFAFNNPIFFNDPFGDKAQAPPEFRDVTQLFNYILKNGVNSFSSDFTMFEVGDGGAITDTWVGGSLGQAGGASGVWLASSGMGGGGYGGVGEMQELVMKTKFVALERFRVVWNGWSQYQKSSKSLNDFSTAINLAGVVPLSFVKTGFRWAGAASGLFSSNIRCVRSYFINLYFIFPREIVWREAFLISWFSIILPTSVIDNF
jgi:hypothetical protein